MYRPFTTSRFDKDLKRSSRRGKNLAKIKKVMVSLVAGKILPIKNRDHFLTGNYAYRRECHIAADWLLIYRIDEDAQAIIFERTGSHSDLFG